MTSKITQAQDDILKAKRLLASAEDRLKELQAQEAKPERKWVVGSDGSLVQFVKEIYSFARQGRAFATKEEAELFAERERLVHRLREVADEVNGDWVADWSNRFQAKKVLYWSHARNRVSITSGWENQACDLPVLRDSEAFKQLQSKMTQDELKLILTRVR